MIMVSQGLNSIATSLTHRKMNWNPGHLWTVTTTQLPRTMRWWYSIHRNNNMERVEDLIIPREYDFDTTERYFQIVDHWDEYLTSVTPIVCPYNPITLTNRPLEKTTFQTHWAQN